MSNKSFNLPIPGSGAGAAVDISVLGREKTISVAGSAGLIAIIEYSIDGVVWCQLEKSFQGPDKKVVEFSANFARVRVTNAAGPTNVDIASNTDGNQSVEFTIVPNGTSAPVDVSALGTFNTFIADVQQSKLLLQISLDGATYEDCMSLSHPDNCESKSFTAIFARVVDSGSGASSASLSAVNDAVSASSQTYGVGDIVFRPGATGADAPGGNVYTVWEEAFAELQATKEQGWRNLEFDSRFSPHTAFNGAQACLLPSSIGEPGGVWDFFGVRWRNVLGSHLDIEDGAKVDGLQHIEGHSFVIHYDGETPESAPFPVANGGITMIGGRTDFVNDNPLAAPMFRSAFESGFFLAYLGSETFGKFQPNGASLIDLNNGTVFLATGAAHWEDNTVTDLSVEAEGLFRNLIMNDGSMTGIAAFGQFVGYQNPNLPVTAESRLEVLHRDRMIIGPVNPGPAINAFYNELVQVDATDVNAPVTVTAPSAISPGDRFSVKDSLGGATAPNPITIAALAGETIEGAATVTIVVADQCKEFRSDQFGNWIHTATS